MYSVRPLPFQARRWVWIRDGRSIYYKTSPQKDRVLLIQGEKTDTIPDKERFCISRQFRQTKNRIAWFLNKKVITRKLKIWKCETFELCLKLSDHKKKNNNLLENWMTNVVLNWCESDEMIWFGKTLSERKFEKNVSRLINKSFGMKSGWVEHLKTNGIFFAPTNGSGWVKTRFKTTGKLKRPWFGGGLPWATQAAPCRFP